MTVGAACSRGVTRRARYAAALGAAVFTALSGGARAQDPRYVAPAGPGPGFEQQQPPGYVRPADRGFGNRGAFVFSVEKILGYQRQEFGQENSSGDTLDFESFGVQTLFWGHVGLFGMFESGWSVGSLVGLTRISEPNDDLTLLRLGPRVGYAGSLEGAFGYWLRAGPSVFLIIPEGGDSTTVFALSGEIYAVFTPVPHLGILLGPTADIHLAGESGNDNFSYSSYGFTGGLFGEFW